MRDFHKKFSNEISLRENVSKSNYFWLSAIREKISHEIKKTRSKYLSGNHAYKFFDSISILESVLRISYAYKKKSCTEISDGQSQSLL